MQKKNILKNISFFIITLLISLISILLVIHLVLLPKFVQSYSLNKFLNKALYKTTKLELSYTAPELKTYLKPLIDFKIKDLYIKKGDRVLVELNDFETSISFNKIFSKQIKINKFFASTLIVKMDKLLEALEIEQQEQKEKKPLDWRLNLYNAKIGLDNLEISYNQNKTNLDIFVKDIKLLTEPDHKDFNFEIKAIISKNKETLVKINSTTINEIKLYRDSLAIHDLNVFINDSRLDLNSTVDKNGIFINAKSNKFLLSDIFNLINTNLIVPNGEKLLLPLNSPNGNVSFDVNMKNNELSGNIDLNNVKANLKDVSNLPLNVSDGEIIIQKDKIIFKDLIGYYGKNKKNKMKIFGDIKDYYNSIDSNIIIDTHITNEFFKDYLSHLICKTVLVASKPLQTRIIYKSKNNIMDITWFAKLNNGVNFGVGDSKSALMDYDRAIKGDFHIDGADFTVKNINYYIANDLDTCSKDITPILVLDAKMDLKTLKLNDIGFKFAREMPSEFLNVFIGQSIFKKGTVKGDLHVAFKNDIPVLNANMEINKTRLPKERLYIDKAVLKTDSSLISIDANGKFKQAKYDFQGRIKNELQPPFEIKNFALELDKVDVEKFLLAVNNKNTETKEVKNNSTEDDNYMFDTNLIRIDDGNFILHNGNFKELEFGNIKSKITLDKNGKLQIKSNKFNIAEGTSSLDVNCDLKNLKYKVKLGAVEVNSNLLAKVLFNLDKEITGKASGLIELYSDKSLKMNGDIKFLVNNGTIGKIGLVEYLLKVASVFRNPVAMMSPSMVIDIVNIPEGEFDKITGRLLIKDNVIDNINIKSYSKSLSALIRGKFDMERHDTSLRIYTRFTTNKKSMFGFLRNLSLNTLANKIKLSAKNDQHYYKSELVDLPQIDVPDEKTQIFLTIVEGDVEHNNFLSSLKKIK